MSDSKRTPVEEFSEEIQSIKASESYANHEYNNSPAKSVPVKMRIDPAVLLNQLQELRKEGVDESTIRAALNEAMEAAQGEPRKARNSMKAHRDAPKMPSQEEMNQIYVRRYAHGIDDNEIQNETVSAIVKAIDEARKRRVAVKPALRVRIATYFVRKALQGLIYLCRVLGVK
jgi:hypothetical protein